MIEFRRKSKVQFRRKRTSGQRSQPGDSPHDAIDAEHPELPFGSRFTLKNLAGPDDQAGVRYLHERGFEAVPIGAYNYAVRKPGGKWFKLDPSSWELKDVSTDLAGDIFKGITTGIGIGLGTAGGSVTGPGAIGWGALGGAGGSMVGEGALQLAGKLAGVKATPGETGKALVSEGVLGGAFGGAGQVAKMGLKAAAPHLRRFKEGQRFARMSREMPQMTRTRALLKQPHREEVIGVRGKVKHPLESARADDEGVREFLLRRKPLPAPTWTEVARQNTHLSDEALLADIIKQGAPKSFTRTIKTRSLGTEVHGPHRDRMITWKWKHHPGQIQGAGGGRPPGRDVMRFQGMDEPGYQTGFRDVSLKGVEKITRASGQVIDPRKASSLRLPQTAPKAMRAGETVGRIGGAGMAMGSSMMAPFRSLKRIPGVGSLLPTKTLSAAAAASSIPVVQQAGMLSLGGQAVNIFSKVIAGDISGQTIRQMMLHPRLPAPVRAMMQKFLQGWDNPKTRQVGAYLLMRNATFRQFIESEYSR